MSVLDDLLVCPACHGALAEAGSSLTCRMCDARYPRRDGIADLRPDPRSRTDLAQSQADFFDHETDAEWEIERPHGAPRLYGWLMAEKFRRSVSAIHHLLGGATILTVCGGSGMDAEFLAAAGGRVIASDVSHEAVDRARIRAQRHGRPMDVLVADVNRLPFRDRSIGVVYVHDGLHHLERPLDGLREMARVARTAVSLSEPAQAAATELAIRIGVAQDVEEAGNRVERLAARDAERVLSSAGFEIVESSRYGMFYRHEPGLAMRLLSRGALVDAATLGLRSANRLGGRFGNKMTVQAIRRDAA